MVTFFLLIVWLIAGAALWGFATNTSVSPDIFKRYEFRIKGIFYWLALILSLVIGILIG